MKRNHQRASVASTLSHDALEEIARLAGVPRDTVSRVLLIRARAGQRVLSKEAKRLISEVACTFANERSVIYFIQAERTGRIKIGTTRHLKRRLGALRAASPVPLRVIGLVRGGMHLERMLHLAFAPLRRGRTEWFEPGESLLAYIRELQAGGTAQSEERSA